jgi:hypothetical protein
VTVLVQNRRMVASRRTALLILRVWREDERPSGLTATITSKLDYDEPEGAVRAASSVEEIESVVRSWLQEFVSS